LKLLLLLLLLLLPPLLPLLPLLKLCEGRWLLEWGGRSGAPAAAPTAPGGKT